MTSGEALCKAFFIPGSYRVLDRSRDVLDGTSVQAIGQVFNSPGSTLCRCGNEAICDPVETRFHSAPCTCECTFKGISPEASALRILIPWLCPSLSIRHSVYLFDFLSGLPVMRF